MGIVLIAKGEDFSGVSIGSLGIFTSVKEGLLGLFETRKDAANATKNRAVGVSSVATVFGSPVFSPNDVLTSKTNGIDFGFKVAGNHTIAAVFKIQATTTNSIPCGMTPSSTGTSYFMAGSEIKWESTTNAGNVSLSMAKPLAGNIEMYAARAKNGTLARIDHPRTSQFNELVLASTRNFNYSAPSNFFTGGKFSAGLTNDNVHAFAVWNRSISDAELATFYAEVKAYLQKQSVSI